MNSAQSLHRGDVILVSLPYLTDPTRDKVRPAVIVQNDVGNRFSPNLIVAAISSQLPRRTYPTSFVVRHGSSDAAGTGLDRDSVVQAEVVLTVPKARLVRRLGQFSPTPMRAIDQCLMVSLGLA
jgi:mRNA interferase MazF